MRDMFRFALALGLGFIIPYLAASIRGLSDELHSATSLAGIAFMLLSFLIARVRKTSGFYVFVGIATGLFLFAVVRPT